MRLSVIVPAHDAAATLAECLEALCANADDSDEIIVVDDASSDGTAMIADRTPCRTVTLESRSGPAAARNAGARRARGDALMFVDADVRVHANALRKVREKLGEHEGPDAVFGSYDDDPPAAAFWSQYKNLFHHYVHQQGNQAADTFWGGCGAIRRDAFFAVGGFNEGYTNPSVEDIEMGYRLNTAGFRVHLDKSLQATHLKRWTFRQVVGVDVRRRAVPWGRLLARRRRMAPDLNLRWEHRLSVVLLYTALGAGAGMAAVPDGGAARPVLGATMAAAGGVTLALNFDLYRFFAARRGPWFAARAIAAHWLYYLYCGPAFVWAALTSAWAPPARGSLARDDRATPC